MPVKRGFFASILSLLVFGNFLLVFAQTPTTQSGDIRRDFGELRMDRRGQVIKKLEEIKERVASKTAVQRARTVDRIKKIFDKITGRYESALGRLDKIVAKLQTRINKLKEKGVNTSAAEAALSTCLAKKSEAQAAITDARSKVAVIDSSSTNVRESVKISVEALHSAQRALRSYHKCLVEVTRTLKSIKPKEGTRGAN